MPNFERFSPIPGGHAFHPPLKNLETYTFPVAMNLNVLAQECPFGEV